MCTFDGNGHYDTLHLIIYSTFMGGNLLPNNRCIKRLFLLSEWQQNNMLTLVYMYHIYMYSTACTKWCRLLQASVSHIGQGFEHVLFGITCIFSSSQGSQISYHPSKKQEKQVLSLFIKMQGTYNTKYTVTHKTISHPQGQSINKNCIIVAVLSPY